MFAILRMVSPGTRFFDSRLQIQRPVSHFLTIASKRDCSPKIPYVIMPLDQNKSDSGQPRAKIIASWLHYVIIGNQSSSSLVTLARWQCITR
jgi:hypothetical protein